MWRVNVGSACTADILQAVRQSAVAFFDLFKTCVHAIMTLHKLSMHF